MPEKSEVGLGVIQWIVNVLLLPLYVWGFKLWSKLMEVDKELAKNTERDKATHDRFEEMKSSLNTVAEETKATRQELANLVTKVEVLISQKK